MSRPTKHTPDAMLDAALELFSTGGADAIRVSLVAKHMGAPSGSIYHRFAKRIALGAALWNRTVLRFQAGIYSALDHPDPRRGVVDAVHHAVRYCRENPADATLLIAGPSAVGSERWPPDAEEERKRSNERLMHRAQQLADAMDLPVRRVLFALADLPYSAVRRDLKMPDPIWEALAVEAAHALLTDAQRGPVPTTKQQP